MLVENNIEDSKEPISTGYITLSESLNDYPTLSVVTYTDDTSLNSVRKVGSTLSYAGLSFYLESVNIESTPITDLDIPSLQKIITYSYVHVSKKLLEYPIKTKQFVDRNRGKVSRKEGSNSFYPIGSLISFGKSQARLGSVSCPGFLIEIPNNPSPSDTVTIKSFLDDKLEILGRVYKFSGSTASTAKLGKSGSILADANSNVTLAKNTLTVYKDTVLSWSKKQDYDNGLEGKRYIKGKKNEYIIFQGDFKPHLPPGEVESEIVPSDLSIMVDNSGITKSFKITKYIWNQPAYELEATFGYAHAAIELVADPEKPNSQAGAVLQKLSEEVISSGNAVQEVLGVIKSGKYGFPDGAEFNQDIVWRLLSVKEKSYVYEDLDIQVTPRIQNANGSLSSITVAPEYRKFLTSKVQVLVSENTEGWEIKRFQNEDPSNWSKGSIEAWLKFKNILQLKETLSGANETSKQLYYWMLYAAKIKLEQYLYRKIPLYEKIDYSIAPYSSYYRDSDDVDWDVQFIPKNQLSGNSTSGGEEIPVLFPDPKWSPELMLLARSRYKTSIGLSGNPNYNPYSRNYYGSNPQTVVTGSEEYEYVKYTPLPSKSTKDKVSGLHEVYGQVSDVLDAVNTHLDYTGTFYLNKDYTQISDYGLKDVPIPEVATDNVAGKYPSKLDTVEDRYTSLISTRTAQDHSFNSSIVTQTYSLVEGRPPSATTRVPVYEEDNSEEVENNPYKNSITFLKSNTKGLDVAASVNVPAARNFQEALAAAKFKLQLESVQSGSTISVQTLLNKRPSSIVNKALKVHPIRGNWIIKSASQTVQVVDGKAFYQPVQIDAGARASISVSSKTVQVAEDNEGSNSSVNIAIKANLPSRLGTPVDEIPEGFSRWLDNGV